MNKKITQFRWLAATLMLVAAMVMPSVAWAYNQPNGEGTKESPYQISSGDELYWFAAYVNGDPGEDNGTHTACAVLTTNISVSGEWTPIMGFEGIFDGQGHTISGLRKTNEGERVEIGLFASIESNAEIRNVGIVNCNFIGNSGCQVGGVCGINNGGTITNCYNTGSVEGDNGLVGGICGGNGGTITNCYNTGSVKNGKGSGGICGVNDGTITNCYYLRGTATDGIYSGTGSAEVKTEEQFRNGEVAWLLNGGMTDGSQAWYQTLSGEGYPNLNKDTENRTVYGAYKHGETRPTCSNSANVLTMLHAHAYDSNATDEASGNHDMSCVQDENNQYTWTDNEDYSNATAKCNFICSVCNSKVSKDMTVTPDGDKTNEPAKCIEKGHNYYVASLTFNGTTYTNYYTQEVPDLGHDDSGDVTFNSGYKIYEKVCKRDGCNEVVGYYATSNGSVEARYEGGVYKVPIFCLNDGLAYDSKAQYTVESLEYKRMYYDDKWAAVYVPFAIDCNQLPNFMEMAVINNFHEYEQTDGSYNVVLEVKRKTSGTIPALTPCVMRLKEAPWEGFETVTMRFTNAVFSPAADKYIDCSSVTRYYKFSGSLAKIEGLLVDGRDFVLNEGKLYKANEQTVLLPQRWYLSAEDRAGSSTSSAAMLRSISINVIGDSDGDVTGIEDVHVVTEKVTSVRDGIFDLQGRRLNSEPTNGIYIKNGVKYVK